MLHWLRSKRIVIDGQAWRGAGTALIVAGALLAVVLALSFALPQASFERTLGTLAGVVIALLAAVALWLVTALLRRGDLRFWWGVWLVAAFLGIPFGFAMAPAGVALVVFVTVVATALLGGSVALLRARGRTRLRAMCAAAGGAAVLALVGLALVPGWEAPLERAWTPPVAAPLALDDPGLPGPFHVRELTYGSGHDRQRPEYAASAALTTQPVDGSRLIDGWAGLAGWARTRYWGFDATALPLQGRVWYPDGAGPFPVVLIVHGNHDMEDFSDTGYGYLGELFASRGFVAVSVDENFLNSSNVDLLGGLDAGLRKENDARGWLLLEHLRVLRTWNAAAGNPFSGRLDLDRVMLIGHSRGGEAAAEAALFNRLSHYPDDGRVVFDYGFGIRGVVAIAPADGQYDPRGRPTRLRDIDYLVVQGSHDGDVASFMGSSQYSRVSLAGCASCFKAAFYLVGANHGQFNTSWGRVDLSRPWSTMLNLVPIMDAESQRKVARVVLSAFVETVLHDDGGYRAFLADPAAGRAWLGDGVEFLADYADGKATVLADFEEDDDLSTGTMAGARISTTGLTRWKEVDVPLKWNARDSVAALVGWSRGADAANAEYRLTLATSPVGATALALSLAMSEESPLADPDAEWSAPDSLDFTLEIADRAGHTASVAIASRQPLYPPVSLTTRKFQIFDDVDRSEPVLQRYLFPLERFVGIDAGALASVTLRFDRSAAGAIWLDDVTLLPARGATIDAPRGEVMLDAGTP